MAIDFQPAEATIDFQPDQSIDFQPIDFQPDESGTVATMAAATRATVGVIGRAIAARDFAVEHSDAPDPLHLDQPDEAAATAPMPGYVEPKAVRALPAMASNLGKAVMTAPWPFPRVTAQEVTDAFSMLASMSPDLTQEESQAVIENTMKPGNLEKIVAGAQRAAVAIPESFTSPFGIATVGAGALPGTLGRVVAGGFTVDMASHLPGQYKELKEAIASGDSERITEASGNLLATGGTVAATGKHALVKPNPAAKVGAALMESIKNTEFVEPRPDLVELAQNAPLTARAIATVVPREGLKTREPEILDPTPEPKPSEPTTTPLTTETVAKVVEPKPEPAPPKPEGEQPLTEPVLAADSINTGALGEMGMGGAKPGEFTPGRGTATGIKNAQVDAERQSRGQEPILAPARLSNETVYDRVMARIDTEPGWQDKLIDDLKSGKQKQLDQDEVLALDHRYVELQNAYAKATRDGEQAYKDGFEVGVEAARESAAYFEAKLTELEQVARTTGSEWGRSGQMRQRLLKEDFTLAAMERRARAAKGFEPLTEAEHAEIAQLHAKVAEAERKAAETEIAVNERIAGLEAEKAMAEARAAAATAPLYEPRVLQAAEKFAKFMDKKGDDALARIKARLGRTSAGIDPTILSDVAILGAAKITRGAVELGRWTDAMVRDLGEWFREHADEAWAASQKVFQSDNDSFHKGVDKATVEKVKRAQTDIPGRIADTTEKIRAKAQGEGSPIHSDVKKLVRLLVESDPSITRDALIDRVHGILQESIPGITRLEAMDAISGRGKFWTPDQAEVSKIVRDLSTQIRLVGHQIDVEAGRPLPRTGYQPEPFTDAARREQQKLNDLKRRHGVVVTDPAAQLGSMLAARKTYYTHRIADLQAEIAARERIVKNKSAVGTDPALEALKAEYQAVKADHDAIFAKELTDAQRLERAIAAAERAETAANEQLSRAERGDFTRTAPKPLPDSAILTEIRARTAALREETAALKDLANPKKTPDQIALQSLKARLAREKADLTERLNKGDFSPRRKPPRELPLDPETAAAKAEVTLLKEQFQARLERHKYEQKSRIEKIALGAKEALNLSRAILTSWDVSAVFRQGGFIVLGNPLRGARALGPMFRALVSEKNAAAVEAQILARPNAPLYAKSKLYLAPREGGKLTLMEEAFMSRLASRIPGVGASQRAYITFLNKLRADTFDSLHESLVSGRAATPEELTAISNYINVATGRGNLGKAAAAAETLSTVFFSPRLVASRFQIIAGQPLYRGSATTRFLIGKEYAKFMGGLAGVYGLGILAGATVESNSTSSDFGKLKFGNTRVDPLGGLAQTTVLTSRLIQGEKTNLKGKTEPIRGKVPYGKDTAADVIATFLRTKLSPVLGSGVDILAGKNVVGEPTTPVSVAVNAVVPLSFRDIYDVMLEQGVAEGTAIGILSLFGMGVQNYSPK